MEDETKTPKDSATTSTGTNPIFAAVDETALSSKIKQEEAKAAEAKANQSADGKGK